MNYLLVAILLLLILLIYRVSASSSLSKDYKLLGLSDCAELSKVKKRYRQLSLSKHPDKGGDPEKWLQITAAYNNIIDKFDSTCISSSHRKQKTVETRNKLRCEGCCCSAIRKINLPHGWAHQGCFGWKCKERKYPKNIVESNIFDNEECKRCCKTQGFGHYRFCDPIMEDGAIKANNDFEFRTQQDWEEFLKKARN